MAKSYFQLRDLLIDRLREIFENKIKIEPMLPTDISEIRERITGASPVIYVFYNGYTAGDNTGSGSSVIITQTWTVLLVVRNYFSKSNESHSLKDADLYTDKLISGLLGWDFLEQEPTIGHMPLKLVNSPLPVILDKGALLIPFSFQTDYPLSNSVSH